MQAPRNPPSDIRAAWPALAARAGGRRWLVCLDYDGTLTPIVDRPELARLDAAMRDRLVRLGARHPTAIVSGRDVDDLHRLVGLDGLIYAGSHGLDIDLADGERMRPERLAASDADLPSLVDDLRHRLEGRPGVLLEPKRHTVAVHWRLADPEVGRAAEASVRDAARAHSAFELVSGKMVAELRPAIAWNKGSAVDLLRRRLADDGDVPSVIYVGDDVTDEDAFRALRPDLDVGVLVADPPHASEAGFGLPDVAAVGGFLDQVLATGSNGPARR